MTAEELRGKRGRMLRHTDTEIRCRCGNMMGRRTMRGIEMKCRRCKRIHVIPWSIIDHCCALTDGTIMGDQAQPYPASLPEEARR